MTKLKINILNILRDVDHKLASDTLSDAVSNRLDKSLDTYTSNLASTCKYLAGRNSVKLMKYLSKQKRGDE